MNLADLFRIQAGLARGATRSVGERELTPVAFRLAARWRAPGDWGAGGYAWCYPLAVEIKDGFSTSVRLIPDVTRLAVLGLAALTLLITARTRRGEKG